MMQSMMYEQKFLLALVQTLIVEIPIAVILVKFLYKYREISTYRIMLVSFIASALTLPYFWFILPIYIVKRSIFIITGESLIILAETAIYHQFLQLRPLQAIILSLLANTASVIFGLIFIGI